MRRSQGHSRTGSAASPAAIVGAGPVGLAAALALKRLGIAAAIVSPAAAADDRRTSALLGSSIDLLREIGVWTAIEGVSAPLRSLRIVDATGRLLRAPEVVFHASEIGRDAFGYNIPNAALVAALRAAVDKEGIVWHDAALEDSAAERDRLRLRLSNGTSIDVRLAVAADGRKSKTRAAARIPAREWRYDQAALVLDLAHDRPHDDTSTEFHTPDGPFTLVPLGPGRSSLVWVGRETATRTRAALPDAALALEIERQSSAILGDVAVEGSRQVFPLSGMVASRFAAGRTMLVGEAAHAFPPIGAQGLNLGYRDVAALARVLADNPDDPGSADRIDAYDRTRRADVFLRSTAVDTLNRSLLSAFPPIQAGRSLGLFLLDRIPPLRQALMRRILAPV